jgi:4-diphosphocytidyl-2-C-methyl-D-erythritol kinase
MPDKLIAVQVFAPAKVNLALHVTGQRDDSYHLLDSLVVFASVGDELRVQIGNTISVTTEGPEAAGVPADMRNLVLQVARLFSNMPGASFLLTKNLPVASGIGGGSADAAAAFRGLMTHWSDGVVDPQMFDAGRTPLAKDLLKLGADIPVCLRSVPMRMQGVGEELTPIQGLPLLYAVLVNPRVGVSTPEVFKAVQSKNNPPMPKSIPKFAGPHDLVLWLQDQRNDLQDAARSLLPEIDEVLAQLDADPTCMLARMSGSGATCFGLYPSYAEAKAAAKTLQISRPNWWVRSAKLGGMGNASLPKIIRG